MNELRLILIIVGVILIAGIYWAGRREEKKDLKNIAYQSPETFSKSSQAPNSDFPSVEIDEISSEPRLNIDEIIGEEDGYYLDDRDSDIIINANESAGGSSYVDGGVSLASKITTSTAPAVQAPAARIPPIKDSIYAATTEPSIEAVVLPSGVDPMIINITVMASTGRNFNPQYLKQILEESGLEFGELNIYHYYRKTKLQTEVSKAQRLFSVASAVRPGDFDPSHLDSYDIPGIVLFMQLPGPIDGVLAFEKMLQIGESLAKRLGGVLCDDKHNKLTSQAVHHIKDQISEYSLKLQTKLKSTMH